MSDLDAREEVYLLSGLAGTCAVLEMIGMKVKRLMIIIRPCFFLSFIIIISQTSYIDKDFQKQMVNGQSHVNINRLAETVSAVTKPLVRKLVFLPILFCFLPYLLFFLFTHLFISFTSLIFHQQSYDYCHNFLVLIFIPVTFLSSFVSNLPSTM